MVFRSFDGLETLSRPFGPVFVEAGFVSRAPRTDRQAELLAERIDAPVQLAPTIRNLPLARLRRLGCEAEIQLTMEVPTLRGYPRLLCFQSGEF